MGQVYKTSDLLIMVNGNNQLPHSFLGPETGTEVKQVVGIYDICAGGLEK
jgi:hypothetical protein